MNVLTIGAHFDDVEIGCGGTIAKHIADKDEVIAHVITNSKYNNYDGTSLRTQEAALIEGKEAARILGYHLICDDFETKQVKFNHLLVEAINRTIDIYHIDMIYTHWDYDVHQDHQAIGKATLAAGRKVNRLLMYQSNMYVNSVAFQPNFFVDISQFAELKLSAIKAHKTEVEKFGPKWLDFWHNTIRNNGQRMGVEYAEAFHLVKYLV